MAEHGDHAARQLAQARGGSRQGADELLPLVYAQLRRLARALLAREAEVAALPLQPTALVLDAYLRLVAGGDPGFEGRRPFFTAAAEAMRRILAERARRYRRQEGGDPWLPAPFANAGPADDTDSRSS